MTHCEMKKWFTFTKTSHKDNCSVVYFTKTHCSVCCLVLLLSFCATNSILCVPKHTYMELSTDNSVAAFRQYS